MQFFKDLSLSAVTAGFVAVLVGFTSSVALVFQAAQAFQATPAQITSWMWALGLGMGLCLLLTELRKYGDAVVILPLPVACGIFVLTLVMCLGASLLSIRKIMRIDPAVVFRGR